MTIQTVSGTGPGNTWTAHTTIAAADTLRFDPNVTTTLTMDAKNLIILGRLEMKPANVNVIHTLHFANVDDSLFVPGGLDPKDTDPGLWVMGDGVLDILGTPRVGWNNTGTSATWQPTDTVLRAPNAVPDAGTAWYASAIVHTQGSAVPTATGPDGTVYPTEVFNITRNVIITGDPTGATVDHRSHVFIRSTQPQSIKYALFNWMGPRKFDPTRPGDLNYSTVVLGRWAVHFHHCMDDSIGSVVTGCVAQNFGGHGFVPHVSNGITFTDCIAYAGHASGFWWDLEYTGFSENIVWDHCMTGLIAPYRDLQVSGAPGFLLGEGGGTGTVDGRGNNIVRNSVAWGVRGVSSAAGFEWTNLQQVSNTLGLETWTTENNIAHNNLQLGVFIWYNVASKHLIDDMVCYNNGTSGVLQGAYHNTFMWSRLRSFGNRARFELHAVSNTPDQTHNMPGSFVRDSYLDGLQTRKHEVPAATFVPTTRWTVIDTVFSNTLIIHDYDGATPVPSNLDPPGNQFEIYIDFVRCTRTNGLDLEPADFVMSWEHPNSQWRVQRRDATAFSITQDRTVPTPVLISTVIPPFWFYVSTQSLTQASQGVSYSQTLTSSLGRAPITWRLKTGSGPLPTGLALSTAGVISGTPTTIGTFPMTFQAVDTNAQIASKDFSLVVNAGLVLQITTSALPGGFVGTGYSQQLVATGGTAPRTFSLFSGTLPAGLSLTSGGLISGVPTTEATYNFTIRVTDAVAAHADRAFTIAVDDVTPVFNNNSLQPGEQGLAYSEVLQASNGTAPYTFSVLIGPLPPGISLASSGAFSGTPTAPFTDYPVRLRVVDATSRSSTRDYVISTYANLEAYAIPIEAHVGVFYSLPLTILGGAPPIRCNEGQPPGTPSGMPPGLSLSNDGLISGVPSVEGTFLFNVAVTDALANSLTLPVQIEVTAMGLPNPVVPNIPLSFGTRGPYGGSKLRDKEVAL